ncbi:hypothetical protein OPV22_008252 [Ensete ventricosum]|uniref:Uncharacterized protein n=1 Tax=Ensete ventricosum TaxID=4639 RepID=A0AAV8R8B0_ENSVE|nr:hypothetical protein OPV22_008252 [Ensete ventricosum]
MRFDAYGAVATICPRIGPIANSDSTLVASHRPIARDSEVCMEETTNVMQRQSPRISLTMFPPCQNSFHSGLWLYRTLEGVQIAYTMAKWMLATLQCLSSCLSLSLVGTEEGCCKSSSR